MIDKDKMFSLFEQPEGNSDGRDLVAMSELSLEDPFTKIGMFTKLIINHNIFHRKLERFLKMEKPDYDVEDTKRASEFTVFNRAWYYISSIDMENIYHLEAIMDFKYKPFMRSLNDALKYFQREDIEQYEKCAKLLKIKTFKRNVENPVPK